MDEDFMFVLPICLVGLLECDLDLAVCAHGTSHGRSRLKDIHIELYSSTQAAYMSSAAHQRRQHVSTAASDDTSARGRDRQEETFVAFARVYVLSKRAV